MPMESEKLQYPDATTVAQAENPTPNRLLESAMAFQRSAVLLSADELGLFAALTAGPCDAGTLASRLGLLPDTTADFLDALVALGLVERHGEHFHNTHEASLFLDPANPSYIGLWLAMARAAMREMADLTRQLRAGGADEKRHPPPAGRMWADIAEILRADSTDIETV
jgi:Dimerisation domain